jgi:hypothetical protein
VADATKPNRFRKDNTMSGTAEVIDRASSAPAPIMLMPVDEPTELTHEVFLQHMSAMKSHYKSANSHNGIGPTHPYALPIHLMFAPEGAHPGKGEGMAAVASPGKAQVDAVVKASQQNTSAFAQHQMNAVNASTNQLQSTHDTSAFAAAMNAQRQKAKAESDKQIDATFDNLINVGTQHPEQQQRILTLTQQIGAFFTNLLAKVASFFTDIYNKIMGWIHSAVDWVKGAAAAVGDWLNKAGSSISHFFGSLF